MPQASAPLVVNKRLDQVIFVYNFATRLRNIFLLLLPCPWPYLYLCTCPQVLTSWSVILRMAVCWAARRA